MTTMAEAVELDVYAQEPPAGEWSYVIDGTGVAYRRGLVAQRLRPGWWPFAFADSSREQGERHQRGGTVAQECGVAWLRLSPDCKNYAWRNEYVRIGPDRQVPHIAHASASLWVAPRQTMRCHYDLDLQAGTFTITDLPDDAPDEIRAQAESKGAKLVAFLADACRERDGERPAPITAADLEDERERQRIAKIAAYCQAHALTFKDSGYGYFVIGGERMSIAQVGIRYLPGLFAEWRVEVPAAS